MNKIIIALSVSILMLLGTGANLVAGNKPVPATSETSVLVERLEEIINIDISALSGAEKQALRKEVRSIKRDLNYNSGGVYISIGTLVLIIILLIILL